MSFYRTYRPQTITELDNEGVRDTLSSLLRKDAEKLPHAFFLYGPKGAGKTTTARIIAKLFNCEKRTKDGPCGVCEQCLSIAHGTHMDVIEIDAASNRGIDDIRALRERIGLSPVNGRYTIYIIDEVHMLTTEAFNALLKTLEEPPSHAVFVLATTDAQKVPATVRSRCVDINFSKASHQNLIAALSRIAKKETMTIDEEALGAIADASDGAFRDAVKMLEQASFLEGAITKDRIITFLSKSDEGILDALFGEIFKGNGKEAVMMIEGYVSEGKDMKMFLSDCVSYLHKKLLDETIGKQRVWDPQMMQDLLHRLTKAYGELRTASITQLPLELAILEFLEKRVVRDEKKDEHTSHDSGNQYYSNISKDNKSSVAHTTDGLKKEEKQKEVSPKEVVSPKFSPSAASSVDISDFLTIEKLVSHWPDFIEALKPYNHSVAGVIRSTRPKSVTGDTVIIEALYPFHKDRLSDPKAHDILTTVLKKLFGANVKVEIVLGSK